eukprot:SM000069S20696  [mRNA]  locus=s69:198138:201808:- [translate_table: standard]
MVADEIRDADEANLLEEEAFPFFSRRLALPDMHAFDHRPLEDELPIVICNACRKPLKESQYAAHAERCKGTAFEREDAQLPVRGAAVGAATAAATASAPPAAGTSSRKPPRKGRRKFPLLQDVSQLAGAKIGRPRKYATVADAGGGLVHEDRGWPSPGSAVDAALLSPRKRIKICWAMPTLSFNKMAASMRGPFTHLPALTPPSSLPGTCRARNPPSAQELNFLCGVLLHNGAHCRRPLTCKYHSDAIKRTVPGRHRPYDALLEAFIAGGSRLPEGIVYRGVGDSASRHKVFVTDHYAPLPLAVKLECVRHSHRMRGVLSTMFREACVRATAAASGAQLATAVPSLPPVPAGPAQAVRLPPPPPPPAPRPAQQPTPLALGSPNKESKKVGHRMQPYPYAGVLPSRRLCRRLSRCQGPRRLLTLGPPKSSQLRPPLGTSQPASGVRILPLAPQQPQLPPPGGAAMLAGFGGLP